MDRSIPGGDLIGRWSLSFADIDFVNSKPDLTRLGLAAELKIFASLGFFAIKPGLIPTDGLSYLADELGERKSTRLKSSHQCASPIASLATNMKPEVCVHSYGQYRTRH